MKKSLLIIFVSLATTIFCAEPVLYLSFDQDFNGRGADGRSVTGKHCQNITMESLRTLLLEGLKGNAVKIGSQGAAGLMDKSNISYPAELLSVESGTLAFWMKPMDWNFKDAKFHIICEITGPNDWLLIYKYKDFTGLSFLMGRKKHTAESAGTGMPYILATATCPDWPTGEFRHIAATWENGACRLFMNGTLACSFEVPELIRPVQFTKFFLGTGNFEGWGAPLKGETLIDEFYLFKQALSAPEIEKMFASYAYGEVDKSTIPVAVKSSRLMADEDGENMNLDFILSRTTKDSKGFPVECLLRFFEGKTVRKELLHSEATEYSHSYPIASLKPGEYELQLTPVAQDAGDKVEAYTRQFIIPNPRQRRQRDDTVPLPWKPVKFVQKNQESILETLMQKTCFDGGLLPGQLFSQDKALLRSPMELLIDESPITAQATRCVDAYDGKAINTKANHRDFSISSHCRMEFDGMMWFQITLEPRSKIPVKNAKIQIHLLPEFSTLFNTLHKDYFGFTGHFAGKLDRAICRNHYEQRDLPAIWVGNEERGLYYFTETQAGRFLRNRDETIRLAPGREGATLEVNLIDYPVELEKAITWSFGLQVTPMRPFVNDRKKWRQRSTVEIWFPWQKIHNTPYVRWAEENIEKKRHDFSRAGKIPLCFYLAGFSASPYSQGYPFYAHQWSQTPPAVGVFSDVSNHKWTYAYICPAAESYRQFYIKGLMECMDDMKINHLYIDNCWSQFCNNARHGCGWKDETGKLYASANVLGQRELAKDIYRALKRQYPEGMLVRHMSQIPEPPLIAFCDALVDGELFVQHVGEKEHYREVFTPDFMRASFLGRQFGLPSLYIPQFERAYQLHYPAKLQPAKEGKLPNQQLNYRHFVGYFLVHDSYVWPGFGVSMKEVWKIFDDCGVASDAAFHAYWKSGSPVSKVSPAAEGVMVSSYDCRDGQLIVIMNDLDNPAEVRLAGVSALVDAETNERLSGTTVTVPARNYRLLVGR
ncbi:MAG: glycoside hydrolase domain-containing protein [Lentisphaeria bacterium]|jgi:hypothetical protein